MGCDLVQNIMIKVAYNLVFVFSAVMEEHTYMQAATDRISVKEKPLKSKMLDYFR